MLRAECKGRPVCRRTESASLMNRSTAAVKNYMGLRAAQNFSRPNKLNTEMTNCVIIPVRLSFFMFSEELRIKLKNEYFTTSCEDRW